jgi:hypothetical protein
VIILLLAGCADGPRDVSPGRDGGAGGEADGGVRDGGAGTEVQCNPAFAEPEACGGDLVGQWTFTSVCGTLKAVSDFRENCPELELVREDLSPSGGFTARDLGTYVIDAKVDFDVDAELPVACVEDIGGCGAFAFVVQLAISGTATCNEVGDQCHCTIVGSDTDASEGTYTVDAGTFTSSSAGETSDFWFCRDGDFITLRQTDRDVVFVFGN